jgi:hypothetical protein
VTQDHIRLNGSHRRRPLHAGGRRYQIQLAVSPSRLFDHRSSTLPTTVLARPWQQAGDMPNRRHHLKSRKGCSQCRSRHVKVCRRPFFSLPVPARVRCHEGTGLRFSISSATNDILCVPIARGERSSATFPDLPVVLHPLSNMQRPRCFRMGRTRPCPRQLPPRIRPSKVP